MKRLILVLLLAVGMIAVWRLGSRLSADAVGMAVGVVLGVLASIPASLLILAVARRREEQESSHLPAPQHERIAPAYQPPVIVLTGQAPSVPPQQLAPSTQAQPNHVWAPRPTALHFKIVGEQENWLE